VLLLAAGDLRGGSVLQFFQARQPQHVGDALANPGILRQKPTFSATDLRGTARGSGLRRFL